MAAEKKFFSSAFNPNQVGFLILYVTNRCNFRCKFCFYSEEIEKGIKSDELTVSELDQISKSIGPLLQLSLTGGEPFLRKELADITTLFLDKTNAKYITIPTNASMPERMLRYLQDILPRYPDNYFRVTFSIEGIESEHDDIRSMPGSFEKIKKSYRLISPLREQYKNLVLDSNSVYSARSEDSLLSTLQYLTKNFKFDNLSVTYARGDIPDPKLKGSSEKKYVIINEYLESLERTKEKRLLYPVWRAARDVSRKNLIDTVFQDKFVTPCVAGRKLIVIGETGDVYPCEILDKSMGNVRNYDYDLKKLLVAENNKQLRNWIVDTKCKCSFECALAANVIWNPTQYPKLVKSAFQNIGRSN